GTGGQREVQLERCRRRLGRLYGYGRGWHRGWSGRLGGRGGGRRSGGRRLDGRGWSGRGRRRNLRSAAGGQKHYSADDDTCSERATFHQSISPPRPRRGHEQCTRRLLNRMLKAALQQKRSNFPSAARREPI